MNEKADFPALLVLSTFESAEDANRIAKLLVERKLAACVQVVGPIVSHYRWQEKIQQSEEWQCQIKTHADAWLSLQQTLLEIHPYDLPELIALPFTGSAAYLNWISHQVEPVTPADGEQV